MIAALATSLLGTTVLVTPDRNPEHEYVRALCVALDNDRRDLDMLLEKRPEAFDRGLLEKVRFDNVPRFDGNREIQVFFGDERIYTFDLWLPGSEGRAAWRAEISVPGTESYVEGLVEHRPEPDAAEVERWLPVAGDYVELTRSMLRSTDRFAVLDDLVFVALFTQTVAFVAEEVGGCEEEVELFIETAGAPLKDREGFELVNVDYAAIADTELPECVQRVLDRARN